MELQQTQTKTTVCPNCGFELPTSAFAAENGKVYEYCANCRNAYSTARYKGWTWGPGGFEMQPAAKRPTDYVTLVQDTVQTRVLPGFAK